MADFHVIQPRIVPGISYAYASLPSAATLRNKFVFVSDLQATAYSDGTRWYFEEFELVYGGLPIILPSSGSIGNNGALTGLTALPTTFTKCYMYFKSGAISAGSAAGLYYVTMSSTTAGTIFNNTYTGGIPTVPTSPTAFSTTGPGAYTQTTAADIDLITGNLPANILGETGVIKVDSLFNYTNSAGAKTLKYKLGADAFMSIAPTTTASIEVRKTIANMGVTNKQTFNTNPNNGVAVSTAPTYGTTDTTAATTVKITAQLATATDYVIVSNYAIVVAPK